MATSKFPLGDAPNAGSRVSISAGIVIVGGGIAGLATALALHRSGLQSLVLERADMLRTSGTSLSVWANAWKALDVLGISDQLRNDYPKINGVQIFGDDGSIKNKNELEDVKNFKHEMRCVERRALLEELAKPLPVGTIRFKSDVLAIHESTKACSHITVELKDGTSIKAKVLIGCDGIHSVVARWMGLPKCKEVGRYVLRGMTVYSNPEGHDLELALHQILGEGLRVGYMPVNRSKVYWFISHRKHPKDNSADSQALINEALDLVRGIPSKIVEVIKKSQPDTVSQATLQIRWVWPMVGGNPLVRGRVTVAGDAMHAMVPDIGQGGCSALEDAVVLARGLAKAKYNMGAKVDDEMGGHDPEVKDEEEAKVIEECLQRFIKERRGRVFALQLKAFMMGEIIEGHWWLARLIRDFLTRRIHPSRLSKHTQFDCGVLPIPPP